MKEITKALALAVLTRTPVVLWGPPGVGKTSVIKGLARQLGLPCEVVISSIREPSDFGGLPVIEDGGVRLHPPAWAVRLAQAGRGVLFLDEISTAPPAVQAALLRVVLDRAVGDLQLPPYVAVVAAANPPEQAAGGWDLAPPLANRFLHLQWPAPPAGEWADGLLNGWPIPEVPTLPPDWEERPEVKQAKVLVATFIRARPELLLQVPEGEKAGYAWPSPRTWEMAARLLGAAEVVGASEEVKALLVSGAVGEAAALEFLAWRKTLDLPDPEELLTNPDKFVPPKRGDQMYAILNSVVTVATSQPQVAKLKAAWKILHKAAEAGGVDVAATAARRLAQASLTAGIVAEEAGVFLPLLREAGLI